MIKLEGIYKYQVETNTHTISFHLKDRMFKVSGDSIKALVELVESLFSPRSDMTMTQYNIALNSSEEDTQVMELKNVS